MANQFFVAPSPHVHSAESTTKIMRDVVIALLPALVVSALLLALNMFGNGLREAFDPRMRGL